MISITLKQFFIIYDFCIEEDDKKIQQFIKNNISPILYDPEILIEKNLKIRDLKYILSKGHTIGFHTKSHLNLGVHNDISLIKDETVHFSKMLSKRLNINEIKHCLSILD